MAISWMLGAILGVVLLLAGAAMLLVGLRGRVVDALPYCRRCRFCLHGLGVGEGSACPECGTSLGGPKAIRIGRRRRRPAMVAVGTLCLLVVVGATGTVGVMWARGFNWNTVKPVWMLEMDSGSANVGTSAGIWGELSRRLGLGTLEGADASRLAERALALQRDQAHPWTPEIGDYIEAAHGAGLVSDEQWAAYYERGMVLYASVRSTVRVGEPIPLRFGGSGARLGSGGGLGLRANRQRLQTRDGVVLAEAQGSAFLGMSAGGSGWMNTALRGSVPIGTHDLVVVVEAALVPGFSGDAVSTFQREFPLSISVVPESQATATLIDAGSPDASVASAITITNLRVESVSNGTVSFYLGLSASGLGVACAFEIVALVPSGDARGEGENIREVVLGTTSFAPTGGQHMSGMGLELAGFSADTLTLILRPSVEAAERTVDLFEIHPGEIRFENHRVAWPEGLERP